jgi:hypothetical protein
LSGHEGIDLEQESKTLKRSQAPPWVLALFLLLWGGIMLRVAYRSVEAWRARSQIRQSLNAPDDEFVVMVNGRSAPNSSAVLGAIRGVRLRMAHHTHPDHAIPIVIRRNQDVLELTLSRDSGLAHEYWVFWTREGENPNRLEIGRLETSVFDTQ